jgi:hypothetical protein
MKKYLILSLLAAASLLLIALSGGFRSAPGATSPVAARFFDPPDSTKPSGNVSVFVDCTKSYKVAVACCDTHMYYISAMQMDKIGPLLILGNVVLEPLSSKPAERKLQLEKQLSVQKQVTTMLQQQLVGMPKK